MNWIIETVDSGRALPGIPGNVTTESGQPYQRFRGKPSNFGWLPESVVGMTGTDRRASTSLIEEASGSSLAPVVGVAGWGARQLQSSLIGTGGAAGVGSGSAGHRSRSKHHSSSGMGRR